MLRSRDEYLRALRRLPSAAHPQAGARALLRRAGAILGRRPARAAAKAAPFAVRTASRPMTERTTAWQCIGCGRLEADATCLGVCQDRKVEVVSAADYDEARRQAD